MKTFLTLFLAMLVGASAHAQQAFSTLEERMTGKEFTDAGLDKLTDEELAALNAWLGAHSVATLDQARAGAAVAGGAAASGGGDMRGFENEQVASLDDERTIVSRIVGSFSGWDGETVFELENGMIWKQAEKDKFYVRPVENPTVEIERRAFKTWRLSLVDYNAHVRVERIQ